MLLVRGSLRKLTISELKSEYPELKFSTRYNLERLYVFVKGTKSWLLIIPSMFTIALVLPLFNWEFINILPMERDYWSYLQQNRLQHIFTLMGVFFAITGIALSNIARKSPYGYRILIKKALFYPLIYSITGISLLITLLYLFIQPVVNVLNLVSINIDASRIAILINYLFICIIFGVVYSFINILRFVSEDALYSVAKKEALHDLQLLLYAEMIKDKSMAIAKRLFENEGWEFTKLFDYLDHQAQVNYSDLLPIYQVEYKYSIKDIHYRRLLLVLRILKLKGYSIVLESLCVADNQYNSSILYMSKNPESMRDVIKYIKNCILISSSKNEYQSSVKFLQEELLEKAKQSSIDGVRDILYLFLNVITDFVNLSNQQSVSNEITNLIERVIFEEAVSEISDYAILSTNTEIAQVILDFEHKAINKTLEMDNNQGILNTCLRQISKLYKNFVFSLSQDALGQRKLQEMAVTTSEKISGIISILSILFRKEDYDIRKRYNKKFETCYRYFLHLLYSSYEMLPFNMYLDIINSLNNTLPVDSTTLRLALNKVREMLKSNVYDQTTIDEYGVASAPSYYWTNARYGLLFWSFVLFKNGKMEVEKLKKLCHVIESPISDEFDSSLNRLYPIISTDDYLGMESWDCREHLPGDSYYKNSFSYWFLEGWVLLHVCKDYAWLIDIWDRKVSQLNTNEQNDYFTLTERITTACNTVVLNYDTWSKLFEAYKLTKEEVTTRAMAIVKKLKSFKEEIVDYKHTVIIKAGISHDKVRDLLEEATEIWRKQANFYVLFSMLGKIERVPFELNDALSSTDMLRIADSKQYLIDDTQSAFPFYISSSFGEKLCNIDERLFMNRLFEQIKLGSVEKSIITSINKGIAQLVEKYSPTLILLHSSFRSNKELLDNGDYVPSWKNNNPLKSNTLNLGKFKNINVMFSDSNIMSKKVLVCDLVNAFSISLPNMYSESPVFLEINKIDEQEATQIFESEIARMKDSVSGVNKDRESRILKLQQGVNVTLGVRYDYSVKDINACSMIEVDL